MNNTNNNLEIERKFLLNPNEIPKDIYNKHIKDPSQTYQGYLSTEPGYEVRISIRGFLTRKTGLGLVREEYSEKIPDPVVKMLWPLTKNKRVKKTRYYLGLPGGYMGEWDSYGGKNSGLNTIEVEFKNKETAEAFQPPDWFGREVTNELKYKNASLAC
jgi:adenylate cyclase